MKPKYLIVTLTLVAVLVPAFALANVVRTGTANTQDQTAAQNQEHARVKDLDGRGDTEINRRVTALGALTTKINALKVLTAAQKADLVSQINAYVTNLGTLKTKIDGDSDFTTLHTDVQSIIGNYRVFALFMPKINLMISADRASDVADRLTSLATKLSNKIDTAAGAGKDVTALKTALSDMNTKITDAKTQISAAISILVPLDPSGYPGNKTQLQAARTDLKAARTDLFAARTDAKTIIDGLTALK
jgi:hypothetical protein